MLGDTLNVGTPSDDTVGAAQIKNDLISGTTALASEPADTDEFLVSDAGTLKRIDYSLIKGGGITEADQWRLTADLAGNNFITANPIIGPIITLPVEVITASLKEKTFI